MQVDLAIASVREVTIAKTVNTETYTVQIMDGWMERIFTKKSIMEIE